MPIENIDSVVGFKEGDEAQLNKILDDIREKAGTVRYVDTAPTTANIQQNEIVVFDDGSSKKIYFRTAKGNLITVSTDTDVIIVENRTNDNGCTETGRLWFRTDV